MKYNPLELNSISLRVVEDIVKEHDELLSYGLNLNMFTDESSNIGLTHLKEVWIARESDMVEVSAVDKDEKRSKLELAKERLTTIKDVIDTAIKKIDSKLLLDADGNDLADEEAKEVVVSDHVIKIAPKVGLTADQDKVPDGTVRELLDLAYVKDLEVTLEELYSMLNKDKFKSSQYNRIVYDKVETLSEKIDGLAIVAKIFE